MLSRQRGETVELEIDCPGQAASRLDEQLVLSEYVVHLALCLRESCHRGVEVIVRIDGESAGGIYVALAAGAERVEATPDARVRVLPEKAIEVVLGKSLPDETLADALAAGIVDRIVPIDSGVTAAKPEVVVGSSNFYLEISRVVEANPDRIAVDSGDGATMTYGELDAGVARYANSLHDLGLQRGDRVAVQVNKCVPSLLVYLACLRAGLVYLPLNTAYRSAELDYFLRDAEPGLVLVEPEQQSEMQALSSASIGASVMTLKGDGATSLAQRAAGSGTQYSMQVPAAADELAVIIYTSGTTGRSKGAMVTHGNLVSNARALTRTWQFRKEDVLLHALPIFHVHGLFVANHCALTTGACLRWKDRFNAAELAREIWHCTVLMGVPTYYVRLLDQPGLSREVCANMRLFVSGSAPLLAETHREFEQRTGHRILERYGMSEAGMITSNPYDGERRAGAQLDFPLAGSRCRVVDDANNPVPLAGKVQSRSRGRMSSRDIGASRKKRRKNLRLTAGSGPEISAHSMPKAICRSSAVPKTSLSPAVITSIRKKSKW